MTAIDISHTIWYAGFGSIIWLMIRHHITLLAAGSLFKDKTGQYAELYDNTG